MLGCCACLLASVLAVALCPDNSINYEEFRNAFRAEAITRKLADKMMRAVESGKANIREIFEAMDTNGEGLLNREMFRAALEELGLITEVSPGEMDELMAFVDADGKYACCACSWSCNSNCSSGTDCNAGDDKVDLAEFIALCGGDRVFAANAARFQQTTGAKRGYELAGAVAMAAMAPMAPPTGTLFLLAIDFFLQLPGGCRRRSTAVAWFQLGDCLSLSLRVVRIREGAAGTPPSTSHREDTCSQDIFERAIRY